MMKQEIKGNAIERIPKRKDFGFVARLSPDGTYNMHVDTEGSNIS